MGKSLLTRLGFNDNGKLVDEASREVKAEPVGYPRIISEKVGNYTFYAIALMNKPYNANAYISGQGITDGKGDGVSHVPVQYYKINE